jgi:hypothetical protein
MASEVALTHLDVYKNLKLHEEFSSLKKEDLYGFGVRGKKFVLIHDKDSLISQIWFSILEFFGFIKTGQPVINKLLSTNNTHFDLQDYKDWANNANKLLPSEVAALKADNAAKASELATTTASLTALKETHNKITKRLNRRDTRIAELKRTLQVNEGEKILASMKENRFKAIIKDLKPKFDFANDKVDQWLKDRKIPVIHNVTEAVATVKAAGAAVAATSSSSNVTALPQGDDTLVKVAS